MDLNTLCTFDRGHCEKHFCEIILHLDRWLCYGDVVSRHFILISGAVGLCNFGRVYMRNISVKYFEFGTVIKGMWFKDI